MNYKTQPKISNNNKLDWWIEIRTINPSYIYYFGAFDSWIEAVREKYGFIEDLNQEKAIIMSVLIIRCQPEKLTISLDKSPHFQSESRKKIAQKY